MEKGEREKHVRHGGRESTVLHVSLSKYCPFPFLVIFLRLHVSSSFSLSFSLRTFLLVLSVAAVALHDAAAVAAERRSRHSKRTFLLFFL